MAPDVDYDFERIDDMREWFRQVGIDGEVPEPKVEEKPPVEKEPVDEELLQHLNQLTTEGNLDSFWNPHVGVPRFVLQTRYPNQLDIRHLLQMCSDGPTGIFCHNGRSF